MLTTTEGLPPQVLPLSPCHSHQEESPCSLWDFVFPLMLAQQKGRISAWRHKQSHTLEKGFCMRCDVEAISINFWLCPQSAIPGLPLSCAEVAVHITSLVCHLYGIFGLGTVESHLCTAKRRERNHVHQWTHNREFIKVYLLPEVCVRIRVRRGFRKQSFYFRHEAKDYSYQGDMCVFLGNKKSGQWQVSETMFFIASPSEEVKNIKNVCLIS